MRSTIFLVTALVAASSATPWGSRSNKQCAAYCKETSKFSYQPGTVYSYDYLAESASQIRGTSDEESRLHIRAKAEFQVVTQCEFVLRLKDVILEESDPRDASIRNLASGSAPFATSLEKYPLMFSFQDGHIEHICPSVEEDKWALNIKRGVLSSLQNSMKDLAKSQSTYETDVTGHCESNYTVISQSRSGVTVRRNKNLMGCTGRSSHVSSLQSTPYSSTSAIQSLPLLKCENECQQIIRNKRLEKSTCVETHLFQPFSNENSGAVTKIAQSLIYKSERPSTEMATDLKRKRASLLFDEETDRGNSVGKESLISSILTELSEKSAKGIPQDIPRLFSRLVAVLRQFSYAQLSKIYLNIPDAGSKKFFTDAAPLVGTAASMALTRDLARDGVLSENEIDLWLSTLAFHPKPNVDMIVAVAPMLSELEPRPKALLGISAMINTYCRLNAGCFSQQDVLKTVSQIEKFIGKDCQSHDEREKQVILLALKALGNAGVLSTSAETLSQCYQKETNAITIRLAAIDAIRRIPCNVHDRGSLLSFYRDMNQDSELRIAAYLAVMRCPTPQILEEIKQALTSEGVNQVGSFVWTHLTNLQETSSPSKQQIKQMLSSEFLRNKFNTDVRKYSRNFEVSQFWEDYNVGATVESNIIFSSKSYLPRSGMLNLTVDLFGESVNLLELGARVEGFETLVESFFGPNGIYPEETIEKVLQSIRGKRQVDDNSLNQLASVYDIKANFADEPQGDVYLRIFGNELHNTHFKGWQSMKKDSPLSWLLQAVREKDIDFTKSLVFLDISYIVPTVIGLPLNLTVNGTATVGLKMGGQFTVNDLSNLEIRGHIRPTAAMEINGIMAVDAFVGRSGIQVRNTMHSSVEVDGQVVVKGSELVSVRLNTPRERMDIFNMDSKIFFLHRGEHRPVKTKSKISSSKVCTPPSWSRYLGLEVCSEIQFVPSSHVIPSRPLNGPSNAAVYIKKTDIHSGYDFQYKWDTERIRRQSVRTISVNMDTPNSRVNRRISAVMILDEPNRNLRFSFLSPMKTAQVTGKYDNNDVLKGVDVLVAIDENEWAAVRASIRRDIKAATIRYEPVLVVTRRGRELVNFQGFYSYTPNSKYSFDFQLKQLTVRPVLVSGEITRDNGRYDATVSLKSYFLDTTITTTARHSDTFFSGKIKSDYSLMEATSQSVEMSAKYSRIQKGSLQKISLSGIIQSTQWTSYNTDLNWEFQTSPGYVENNGRITIGKNQWNIQQLFSNQGVRGQREVNVRLAILCPQQNADFLVSYQQQTNESKTKYLAQLRLSQNREWSGLVELTRKYEPTFYGAVIEMTSPQSNRRFRAEVAENQPQQWNVLVGYRYKQDPETTVTASYKNLSTGIKLEYVVELQGRGLSFDDLDVVSSLTGSVTQTVFKLNGQYGDSRMSASLQYDQLSKTQHQLQAEILLDQKSIFTTMAMIELGDSKSILVDVRTGRRITLDAKLVPEDTNLLAKIDFFWDKERDLKQTFSFAAKMSALNGEVLIRYPGRTVKIDTVFKGTALETQIQWASDKKMNINLNLQLIPGSYGVSGKITTPFAGYEQVLFDLTHKNSQENVESRMTVGWHRDRFVLSFIGVSTQHEMGGALYFKSTFHQLEDISIQLDTVKSTPVTQLSFKIKHNERQIQMLASCNRKDGDFSDALVSLTTPIPGFETFTVTVQHNAANDGFQCTGKMELPAGHHAVLSLTGIKTNTKVGGTLALTSTFEPIKSVSTSWQYLNDDANKKLLLVTEVNGKRSVFDASTAFQATNILANLQLSTPLTNDIRASLRHQFDQQIETRARVSWAPDREVEMAISGQIIAMNNVNINTLITGLATEVSVRLEHRNDRENLATGLELAVNGKRVLLNINGQTTTGDKARDLRLNAQLKTPFTPLDDVKVDFQYNRNVKSIKTKLDMSQRNKMMTLEHEFHRGNAYNWQNYVTMKIPSQADMRLSSKQSLVKSNLVHDTEILFNNKQLRFLLTGIQDKNRLKATSTFSSSWTDDFTVQIQHEDENDEFHPIVTLQTGNSSPIKIEIVYKRTSNSPSLLLDVISPIADPIQLHASYHNENGKKMAHGAILWNTNQKIDFSTELIHFGDAKLAKISIITPFDGLSAIGAEGKLDVDGNRKSASALLYREDSKIQTEAFTLLGADAYVAEVIVTTPFETFESLKATGHIDFSNNLVKIALKRGKSEIQLKGSLVFEADKIIATANWTSPIRGLESISVESSFDFSNKLVVMIDFNGKITHLEGAYTNAKQRGSVYASIKTPLPVFASGSIEARYDFSANTKSASVTLRKNGETIRVQGQGVLSASVGQFSANLKAPCCGIQDLDASGSYNVATEKKMGQINVVINGKKSEFNGKLLLKQDIGDISISAITAYPGYEQLTLNGKYDLTKPEKTAALTVVKNSDKTEVSAIVNLRHPLRVDSSLTLKTPLEMLANVQITGKYDLRKTEKTAELLINRNEDIFKLTASGSWEGLQGKINAALQTTFKGLELWGAELVYQLEAHQKIISVTLDKNSRRETLSFLLQLDKNHLMAQLKNEDPSQKQQLILRSNHVLDEDQLRLSVILEANAKKIIASLEGSVDLINGQVALDIKTPFTGLETFSIVGQCQLDKSEKIFNIQIKKNNLSLEIQSQGQFSVKNSQVAFRARSSLVGWESVSASFSYDFRYRPTISASFLLEKNGVQSHFSGEASLSPDSAKLSVQTPFQGMKSLGLTGQLSSNNKERKAVLKWEKEGDSKSFSVAIRLEKKSLEFLFQTPLKGYENLSGKLSLDSDKSTKSVALVLTKNDDRLELNGYVLTKPNAKTVELQLSSTIAGYEEIQVGGQYDLSNPTKTVSARVNFNGQSVDLSGAVTIERDSIRVNIKTTAPVSGYEKLILNGEIHFSKQSVRFSLDRNGKLYEITGSVTYDGTNFGAHLTTPFVGYETFSVTGNYSQREIAIEIATPFANFHKINLKADYDNSSNEAGIHTVAHLAATHGQSRYEIRTSFKLDDSRLEFNGQLQLPIRRLEHLAATLICDFEEGSFFVAAEKSQQRFQLAIKSLITEERGVMAIQVQTPISGFKEMDISGSYDLVTRSALLAAQRNGKSVFRVTGAWNLSPSPVNVALGISVPFLLQQDIGFALTYDDVINSLEGSINVADVNIQLNAKCNTKKVGHATLSTNLDLLKNVRFIWDFSSTSSQQTAELSATIYEQVYKASLEGQIQNSSEVNVKLSLVTPPLETQFLSIEWNAVKYGRFTTRMVYDGLFGDYESDLVVKYGDNFITTDVSFKTPFPNWEDFTVNGRYTRSSEILAEGTLRWANGEKIQVILKGELAALMSSVQLVLRTPFTEELVIEGRYNFMAIDKTLLVKYMYGIRNAQLDATATLNSPLKAATKIHLSTPFPSLKEANLVATYDLTGNKKDIDISYRRNELVSKFRAGIDYQPKTISLTTLMSCSDTGTDEWRAEAKYDTSNGLRMEGLVTWMPNKTIKAALQIDSSGISTSITTPFRGFEKTEFVSTFNFDTNDQNVDNHFMWNGKKMNLKASWIISGTGLNFSVRLTTPFEGFEDVRLRGVYSSSSEHSAVLSYSRGSQVMELNGKIITNKEASKGRIVFSSELTKYQDLNANIEYDWSTRQKSASVILSHGSKRIAISTTGEFDDVIVGSITLEAPSVEPMKLSVGFDFKSVNQKAEIVAEWGSQQIAISGALIDNKILRINLQTPFDRLKKVTVNSKIDRNAYDLAITYNQNKPIQLTGTYLVTPNVYSLNGTLTTPFRDAESISISSFLDASRNMYGSGSFQWASDKIIAFNTRMGSSSVEAILRTPFNLLKKAQILANYKWTANELAVAAGGEYNEYQGSLEGRLTSQTDIKHLTAKASWNRQTISFEAKYENVPNRSIHINGQLLTPFQALSNFAVTIHVKTNKGQMETNVKIDTPFSKMPSIILALQTVSDVSRYQIALSGSAMEYTVKGRGSFTKASDTHSVSIDLEIPFVEQLRLVSLRGDFQMVDWRNINGMGSVKIPSGEYATRVSVISKSSDIIINAGINTPTFSQSLDGGLKYSIKDNLSQISTEIYIGDNKLAASYNSQRNQINGELRAMLPFFDIDDVKLGGEIQYRSVSQAQATLTLSLAEEKHQLLLKYHLTDSKLTAQIDADSPMLQPKRSINLKIIYDDIYASGISIDAKLTDSMVHEMTASLVAGDVLKAQGKLKCPMLGDMSAEMDLGFSEGKLAFQTAQSSHRLDYKLNLVDGYDIQVGVDSPLINPTNVKGIWKLGEHLSEISLDLEYGKVANSLAARCRRSREEIVAELEVKSPFVPGKMASFQSRCVHGSNMETTIVIHVLESVHRLRAALETVPAMSVELRAESPLLPWENVGIAGQVQYRTSADLQGELNLSYGDQLIRLSGNLRYPHWKDMEGFVTLNTPFQLLSMARINGRLNIVNGLDSQLEILTSHPSFPKAAVVVKYQLGEYSFDASASLTTPIRHFEDLALVVNIPLSTENAESRLNLTTPFGQYALLGRLEIKSGKLNIQTEMDYDGRKFAATITFRSDEIYQARIDVKTPIRGYENYSWDVKGQANVKRWGEAIAFLDWNGKRIEFTSNIKAEPRAYIAVFKLVTPFVDFERYALHLRLEGTERKTIQVEVEYPGSRIGADFDYVFHSGTDFICKASVNTPFQDYESFSIQAVNRLADFSYTGHVEARFAHYGVSFNLDAAVQDESAEMVIQAAYNDQVIIGKAKGNLSTAGISASLNLDTPFQVLRNVECFLQIDMNQLSDLNRGFGLNVNNRKILLISQIDVDGARVIQVENPWRPIAVTYSFQQGSDLKVAQVQFCWDLTNRKESTIGGHLTVKKSSYGKQIRFRSLIPDRIFVLEYDMELTSSKLDHALSVSWAEGKTLGYKIFLEDASTKRRTQLDAILRFDLPIRSFELESHHVVANSETSTCLELKWDAAADRTKRLGARIESKDLQSWDSKSRQISLFLVHSALEKDIVLRGQYARTEDQIKGKFEVDYSPFEEHRFLIETSLVQEKGRLYNISLIASHPVSHINLRLSGSGHLKTDDKSAMIRIDYEDRNGKAGYIQLRGQVKSLPDGRLDLEIRTADNSLLLSNSLVNKRHLYTLTSRTVVNDINSYSVHGQMDTRQPMTAIDVSYADGMVWNVYAGMPNQREILVKTSRDVDGKTVTDGYLNMKLNRTDLFSSRLYWRATSRTELKNIALNYWISMFAASESILNDVTCFVGSEFADKRSLLLPISNPIISRLVNDFKNEMKSIGRDFQTMRDEFISMYDNDEFYLQYIVSVLQDMAAIAQPYLEVANRNLMVIKNALVGEGIAFYNAMRNTYSVLAQVTSSAYEQITRSVSTTVTEVSRRYDFIVSSLLRRYQDMENALSDLIQLAEDLYRNYAGRLEQVVMDKVEELRTRCIELAQIYAANFRPYTERITAVYNSVREQLAGWQETINDAAQVVRQKLLSWAPVRRLVDFYLKYASWLEEFHIQDYIDQVTLFINKFGQDTVEQLKAMTIHYKPYIDAITQAVQGQMSAIQQLPVVAYLSAISQQVTVQVNELMKYIQLEAQLRTILRRVLHHADQLTTQLAADLKGILRFPYRPVIVFQPESGRVEYTQQLPVKWESFFQAPEFKEFPLIKKLTTAKTNILRELDLTPYYYAIMDAFAMYRPALNIRNVIPPFGSHAFIAGTQHYMTFDKKFYEFAGECSYLLVSDFVHNNFSAIVNYEGSNGKVRRKSLTVLSDGRRMEIDSNFRVITSNRRVELPWKFEKTSIKRDGQRIIINNDNGFRIECNLYRDICTVHITGWSFGKTGGLFGIYNNEPNDDFLTPYRQQRTEEEIDSFANSWKVGTSRCRVRNYAVENNAPSLRNIRLCEELFVDESSVLRPCFRLVNPTPFIRMCHNDLAGLENSPRRELGICTAAAAYVSECRLAGLDLWVPPKCVRCELENGLVIGSGEMKNFNGDAPRSADVVFVVDQKSCVKGIRLTQLPVDIDAALAQKGLLQNRFAVVGYGGQNIYYEPHIRTTESQIWVNSKSIQSNLENVNFNGQKPADILAAIRYAVNLPYRAGVSKQIVLITCSNDCSSSGYGDALTLLLENDIKLHILQANDFTVKRKQNAEDIKNIYGIDAEEVYTIKSSRRLKGDRELRRQLVIPKDFCTPLAMETNGTLFNLNKLSSENIPQAKRFSDVFSQRVALTADPSDCQRCDCIGDRDGIGSLLCQRCVSPTLERFMKNWEQLAYENEVAELEVNVQEIKVADSEVSTSEKEKTKPKLNKKNKQKP